MGLIQQQNELIKRLLAEKEQTNNDIRLVAQTVKDVWEFLNIEPEKFSKNKIMAVTSLLTKITKADTKKMLLEKWEAISGTLKKYEHLTHETNEH